MRVAIVGCGRAGLQHAAAVAAAGGRVGVVCDTDPKAARSLSSRVRAPVGSLTDLLRDPAVDVIAVCTPPDSHLTLGLQALSAGKAAVIEKPPALSREGVEELEAASRRHAQPLAVMFQHRGRLPHRALMARWSAKSSAAVEVFRHRPEAHYAECSWRGDLPRSGGGFFAHLAIHYTDLACQLLGDPVNVHAVVEASSQHIDLRAIILVQMTSGALLTVHASSLPAVNRERLCVLDGARSLTVTNRETHYAEGDCTTVLEAPPTNYLRASVYSEVFASLWSGKPIRRFRAGRSVGSVSVLEHVINTLGRVGVS